MLESFEAGFKAWLWPGFTAILAVAATYVVYRLALAVFRHFSGSRTVIRLFLDAAARALPRRQQLLQRQLRRRAAPVGGAGGALP